MLVCSESNDGKAFTKRATGRSAVCAMTNETFHFWWNIGFILIALWAKEKIEFFIITLLIICWHRENNILSDLGVHDSDVKASIRRGVKMSKCSSLLHWRHILSVVKYLNVVTSITSKQAAKKVEMVRRWCHACCMHHNCNWVLCASSPTTLM